MTTIAHATAINRGEDFLEAISSMIELLRKMVGEVINTQPG